MTTAIFPTRKAKTTPINTKCPVYKKYLKSYGGWNPVKKTLTPINFENLMETEEDAHICGAEWALNCIALAVEAGHLEQSNFPEAAFSSKNNFESFCTALGDSVFFWVNDRHFWAVEALGLPEEGSVTYPVIGETLIEFFLDASYVE